MPTNHEGHDMGKPEGVQAHPAPKFDDNHPGYEIQDVNAGGGDGRFGSLSILHEHHSGGLCVHVLYLDKWSFLDLANVRIHDPAEKAEVPPGNRSEASEQLGCPIRVFAVGKGDEERSALPPLDQVAHGGGQVGFNRLGDWGSPARKTASARVRSRADLPKHAREAASGPRRRLP